MSQSFIQQQRAQPRDPIMDDDTFSLRFGNPIKVIHEAQPSNNTGTPMHHVASYLPSLETNTGSPEIDHDNNTTAQHSPANHKCSSPPHKRGPTDSSITRDVANFAEFYHNQDGKVNEIDHA